MDALAVIISSIVFYVGCVEAVPPQACFANFRWDDCGQPPVPVMYYWKPGSRCEVGIWRGCLPSLNMFKSEYECVSTCIFTITPRPANWHELNKGEEVDDYDGFETTTVDGETTTDDGESGSGSDSEDGSGSESGSGSGNDETGNEASGDGSGSGSGDGSGDDEAGNDEDEVPTTTEVPPEQRKR